MIDSSSFSSNRGSSRVRMFNKDRGQAFDQIQAQRQKIRARANDLESANAAFGNALVNAQSGLAGGAAEIAIRRATDRVQAQLAARTAELNKLA
jgi:hypothetical protein